MNDSFCEIFRSRSFRGEGGLFGISRNIFSPTHIFDKFKYFAKQLYTVTNFPNGVSDQFALRNMLFLKHQRPNSNTKFVKATSWKQVTYIIKSLLTMSF